MIDRAGEQIGDGGEIDMRMWPHVDPGAGIELRRTHLIEEDERPDHRPLLVRQRAVDLEAAEIVGDRMQCLQERIVGHRLSSISMRSSGQIFSGQPAISERSNQRQLRITRRSSSVWPWLAISAASVRTRK